MNPATSITVLAPLSWAFYGGDGHLDEGGQRRFTPGYFSVLGMCVFPTLSPFLGDKRLVILSGNCPNFSSMACITHHQIVQQGGRQILTELTLMSVKPEVNDGTLKSEPKLRTICSITRNLSGCIVSRWYLAHLGRESCALS